MSIKLGNVVSEGKSKKFYEVNGLDNVYFMVFKPHLRSITSKREENIEGTDIARLIANTKIMEYLSSSGIPTQLVGSNTIEVNKETGIMVEAVKPFPVEFICRYRAAGSIVRLYPSLVKEGMVFKTPLYKYDLKQDIKVAGVDDPPLFENYITGLGLMTDEQFSKANTLLKKIGSHMVTLLDEMDMYLIDMKMEFGLNSKGEVILIDEISQDCIRANDIKTNEPMTKDAFRNMKSDKEVLNKYIEFNERLLKVL